MHVCYTIFTWLFWWSVCFLPGSKALAFRSGNFNGDTLKWYFKCQQQGIFTVALLGITTPRFKKPYNLLIGGHIKCKYHHVSLFRDSPPWIDVNRQLFVNPGLALVKITKMKLRIRDQVMTRNAKSFQYNTCSDTWKIHLCKISLQIPNDSKR